MTGTRRRSPSFIARTPPCITEIALNREIIDRAHRTFRPDVYRRALAPLGVDVPAANSKVEGALPVDTPVGSSAGRLSLHADPFFDGRTFDPADIDAYVAELAAIDRRTPD